MWDDKDSNGPPCPRTRRPRTSAITRSAAASRRCTADSRKANPATRGPRPKNLPARLVDALNEKVVVTIDGERREITKREAVVTQVVNESARANLRATKMLIDMLKDAEKKAGVMPPPEPAPFTAADEEVMRPSSLGCGNPGRRNFNKEARGTGQNSCSPIPRGCVPPPRELGATRPLVGALQ